jgi:hypothetical protein
VRVLSMIPILHIYFLNYLAAELDALTNTSVDPKSLGMNVKVLY